MAQIILHAKLNILADNFLKYFSHEKCFHANRLQRIILQHLIRVYMVCHSSSRVLDTPKGNNRTFGLTDKYGKELRYPNVEGKYGPLQRPRPACDTGQSRGTLLFRYRMGVVFPTDKMSLKSKHLL